MYGFRSNLMDSAKTKLPKGRGLQKPHKPLGIFGIKIRNLSLNHKIISNLRLLDDFTARNIARAAGVAATSTVSGGLEH